MKKKMGRPPKYRKDFHPEDMIQRMKRGQCVTEICSDWDISRETFYAWAKEHREFSDASKIGKMHLEAWYIQAFKGLGVGKLKGNVTSMIWLSKQVLNWSDKWSVNEETDVEFSLE